MDWIHKSAESGFVNAQRDLGDIYHGNQDYIQAIKWYREAAEQGNASSQCNLGLCYYDGQGVPQDYAESVKWMRKAAEQGNVIAQENLGVAYDRGEGVSQSNDEAARWHQKAAEQGNAGAQNNLGVCYEKGQGVSQDYIEAVKWLSKAADQGLAEAPINLTRCYQEMVWKFSDLLASHTPLIGDCSVLPYPKETLLYAIYAVKEDYNAKREATVNQTLRETYDKVIPTLVYLHNRLAHDWQEIEQEDKDAIVRLSHFDSFPDWALPLQRKYLDDERASREAGEAAFQVMVDRITREKIAAENADGR